MESFENALIITSVIVSIVAAIVGIVAVPLGYYLKKAASQGDKPKPMPQDKPEPTPHNELIIQVNGQAMPLESSDEEILRRLFHIKGSAYITVESTPGDKMSTQQPQTFV